MSKKPEPPPLARKEPTVIFDDQKPHDDRYQWQVRCVNCDNLMRVLILKGV